MEGQGGQEEPKVSKYNSGINIIMRLDEIWRNTHKAVKEGKYYEWNVWLDRAWCELARDLKEEEYSGDEKEKKKGYKEKFEELDKAVFENGDLIDNEESVSVGFQKPSSNLWKKRNDQYKALMAKDLFLRRLENHLGKGTAWDEEDEDGFD